MKYFANFQVVVSLTVSGIHGEFNELPLAKLEVV